MSQLIFTKHALERSSLRSISQGDIAAVLSHPDKTFPGKKDGTVKFIRTLRGREIHVVGNYLKDQYKWLIVSVWVRGEDDPTPIVWQMITFPFKCVWWLLIWVFKQRPKRK